MRRCLACEALFPATTRDCPRCGVGPMVIDGFPAYAPAFAHESPGFEPAFFPELARLEEGNFWFRSRNQLILWALEKYCVNFRSLLELGCGTGYVLSGIARAFSGATLSGSEILTAGLRFAADRVPSAAFMQMDARCIPFAEEFDVIGAFDVLEHVLEDEVVLSQAASALVPGGHVILTVPQHAWLWSDVDACSRHVRRYGADELHRKIRTAGLEIVRTTSFVTSLLPAMMVSRLTRARRPERAAPGAELKVAPWLSSLLGGLLRVELALIVHGGSFPVGGSRIVVARKPPLR